MTLGDANLTLAGSITFTEVSIPSAGAAAIYRRNTDDNLYIQDKPDMMETSLKFIPYYCWSNRGENEMLVWVNEN